MKRLGTVIAMLLASLTAARAEWGPSNYDGEAGKAAMGCSNTVTDDSWLCLAVRCDAPGKIRVYVDLTNISLHGWMTVSVDEEEYEVEAGSPGNAPYSTQFISPVDKLVAALKMGKTAKLSHPEQEITPGYDTVSLRKAGSAIARVEAACR